MILLLKKLFLWFLFMTNSPPNYPRFSTTPSTPPFRFPSSFVRCHRRQSDFNTCLVIAAEVAVRQLNRPFSELGLPSLEPVEIPSLKVAAGNTVGFEQKYKNIKFTGFTNVKFTRFEVDFDQKQIEMDCMFPEVVMDFDYKFDGKILTRDFFGEGHGVITFVELKFFFNFDLVEYERQGLSYFSIIDKKLILAATVIKSDFQNLFGGDQEMKNSFNRMINSNWRMVFHDVKDKYEDIFGDVFTGVFNRFLSQVSISELFGDE
ncbi:hypothetical protein MTP99_005992 [Tenebrio molitor]|nr:hypothetical protein MTP99_005992 [Tenebrio molitor]CAH1383492.1 unnamed protein product [Tenebrio molitor]